MSTCSNVHLQPSLPDSGLVKSLTMQALWNRPNSTGIEGLLGADPSRTRLGLTLPEPVWAAERPPRGKKNQRFPNCSLPLFSVHEDYVIARWGHSIQVFSSRVAAVTGDGVRLLSNSLCVNTLFGASVSTIIFS